MENGIQEFKSLITDEDNFEDSDDEQVWNEDDIRIAINETMGEVSAIWIWPWFVGSKRFWLQERVMKALKARYLE